MNVEIRITVDKDHRKLSHWIRSACFLFVIVDWYTRNSIVYEISHETPRLACFAHPSCR